MDSGTSIVFLIFIIIAGIVYLVPTIIAFRRRVEHRWAIAIVNIVLGYTGFVWIGLIIWACYSRPGYSKYHIVPRYVDGYIIPPFPPEDNVHRY